MLTREKRLKLIDIGINLMNSAFERDREQVVKAAAEAGVSSLIITGSGERSSLDAMLYASKYNAGESSSENFGRLYTTAGVHPHEAKNCTNNTMDLLRQIVTEKPDQYSAADNSGANSIVKAIGECGLDYNRDFSPRDVQRRWFIKQAELAAEFSLPLFLHERDAFIDFSIILREHIKNVPGAVVHCFTGTGDELEYYLSLGCYIGITGWICDERRGNNLRELVKIIPKDKLLLETDGPYLLPRDLPFKVRNKRNEPKYLPHIAETVASCVGKEVSVIAKETVMNSRRFFGIAE